MASLSKLSGRASLGGDLQAVQKQILAVLDVWDIHAGKRCSDWQCSACGAQYDLRETNRRQTIQASFRPERRAASRSCMMASRVDQHRVVRSWWAQGSTAWLTRGKLRTTDGRSPHAPGKIQEGDRRRSKCHWESDVRPRLV